ncbi:MAG: DUF547 domain-containing protein [SAR86 cluster bacterium]|uniref:DUF547 domain-containing protein n=1 Tax=SAR86 cluster bacterium TaxID=2030880 RepID=A0A2A5CCJ2_9GAMM|nr:MAG: DUF547 domain-containing protein [SAR86 cluster bacterium]
MIRMIFLWAFATASLATEPDWNDYDGLLNSHVHAAEKDGYPVNLVDYENISADSRFYVVFNQIIQFDVLQLTTNEEKLAFYINAYNILTINLILDNWPVDSIRDIGSFFRGPWDIVVLENADGQLTLDDIEHNIIRQLDEPRIHFAVNCASVSCPDLRHEAYRADKLDEQLDEQTRLFLNNEKGLLLENNRLRLSKIFDWYGEDFDVFGNLEDFVRLYRPDLQFDSVRTNLPYNWNLNAVP